MITKNPYDAMTQFFQKLLFSCLYFFIVLERMNLYNGDNGKADVIEQLFFILIFEFIINFKNHLNKKELETKIGWKQGYRSLSREKKYFSKIKK